MKQVEVVFAVIIRYGCGGRVAQHRKGAFASLSLQIMPGRHENGGGKLDTPTLYRISLMVRGSE